MKEAEWLCSVPIAHRGLHDLEAGIPENSFAAFTEAIGHGYGIELDVQLTQDKKIVVFHDYSLGRMTGHPGKVRDLDWPELRKLRLARTGEGIPLFSDLLELVAGRAPLLIEVKNEGKTGPLEQGVIDALSDYKGEFAVQSFNPYVVQYFFKHAPYIIRGQLASNFKGEDLAGWKKFLLRYLLLNFISKPAFIAYEYGALPRWLARRVKNKGLLLLAWTVKNPEDYARAKKEFDNVIFENFTAQK